MRRIPAYPKAIFFDADGVLYQRERRWRHLRAYLRWLQLPVPSPDELRRIRAEIRQRLRGAGRGQRYEALLTALGISGAADRAEGLRMLAREAAEITLFPGVAETLRALKARGLKLGVITNTATPTKVKQERLRSRGVDVPWDSFVSSCEVGVEKPHPRIYQIALEQCSVSPAESVFVGHEAAELAGASAVGLRTVAFGADDGAQADERIARFADLLDLACLPPGSYRSSRAPHARR